MGECWRMLFGTSRAQVPNSMHVFQQKPFVVRAMLIVGLGGLIFGYDIGVVAGALKPMRDQLHLTSVQQGLVVGLLALGACLGSLVGGTISDRIGRWHSIHIQNAFFVAGALIVSTGYSVTQVCIGRVVVGFGVAMSSVADLPYLTEVSPLEVRGIVASAYEMFTVLGVFLSFVVDDALLEMENGWRWMFGVSVFVALLQSALVFTLPESPRWLLAKGREEEALKVLSIIHGETAQDELRHLKGVFSHIPVQNVVAETHQSDLWYWRHSIFVVLLVWFFAFFTGGVIVRNYAPRVFEEANMEERAAATFLIVLGASKVIITAFAILSVEHFGRKVLLLVGITLILIGHSTLCVGFAFGTPTVGLYVCGCCSVISGYSISFGPVAWLLQAEMFATNVRGRAVGVCQTVSNLFMFVSNFGFVPVSNMIGGSVTFGGFAVMSVLALICVQIFVVETRGVEPDEVHKRLEARLRNLTFCFPATAKNSLSDANYTARYTVGAGDDEETS